MILALDVGNTTGWARGGPVAIRSGAVRFHPAPGDDPGLRWIRFADWLLHMLPGATLVVYERWTASPGIAAKISAGYITRIEEQAARLSVPTLEVSPAQLKKWLTGNGHAGKTEMRVSMVERGWAREGVGADEADALALLHYGKEHT